MAHNEQSRSGAFRRHRLVSLEPTKSGSHASTQLQYSLAATAKERLAEFLSVQPAPQLPLPRTRDQWQPPPPGTVKINFDGATSAKDQTSGIGVVLRDKSGSVLTSLSQNIPQVCSPIDIETMAAS